MSTSDPVMPDGADEGDVLELDREALLAALRDLAGSSDLAALRVQISGLLAGLSEPAGPLHPAGAGRETTELTLGYLRGELLQIAAAQTLDRARYYVDRLVRAIAEERRSQYNDINLNRWKEREYEDLLTDSLWLIERRDSTGVHSAGYWGNFVPQIPNQLMRRYTRRGEWVIDLFAGLGTTLIEGQRLGRHTLGVELQPEVAARARELLAREPNPYGVVREIVEGDSAAADLAGELARHGARSAQLAILHPPYFDIIRFSEDPRDLSNAASVDHFIAMIGRVVQNVAPLLDQGRLLALVIGDKYARGDWIPLGFLAMQEVLRHGFTLKSIVVKNVEGTAGKRSRQELWRYRALAGGFYVFKHEYLFLLRKL
jgi:hypothetical protein